MPATSLSFEDPEALIYGLCHCSSSAWSFQLQVISPLRYFLLLDESLLLTVTLHLDGSSSDD